MTPEEFSKLKPGDKIALFNSKLDLKRNTYTIQGNVTSESADLTNNGIAINPECWTLVEKAKPKFEVGKQYKNNKLKLDTAECIAIANNGFAILKRKSSHVFEVNPEINSNWEEYIPPIIHKRYVHWIKPDWSSALMTYTTDEKLEHINGKLVLHVQEVSFEEKKNA